ncbi:2-hydroxychromene-2-carboxylate isomerase [Novispirillum itersonii]|uniref:2-hydroxychromene-2-carboxylate isomerase n=1 Tax=Novispirillum itersonii TaxID=189 RepID=UPI00035D6DCC|nr:2-hydroxychromene-2-carboxylate isomerase [Novispirillum itersonii]
MTRTPVSDISSETGLSSETGRFIDYYFSPVSPFAYLGAPRLAALAQAHGCTVRCRPVRMAEVFAATGGVPLPQRSEARKTYRLMELTRISRRYAMPLTLHPAFFPCDDTLAAGVILAAEDAGADAMAVAFALGRGLWAEQRNIADPASVADILTALGLDGAALVAAAPQAEARRTETTAQAIAAGVFGAPTYVWKGELFWGQDRLEYLDAAIKDS